MKKIFTLILCLTLVSVSFAQEKKSSWAVKANFNLATITGESGDSKMKPGFSAGIASEFRMTRIVALSPELLYSMQGIKGESMGIKASITSNYINLPIMVKFYVINKLSIDCGPQFGYLVRMNAKAGDLSAKVDSDTYNAFDMSIGVGATYNFSRLFVSARYNLGLINVLKDVGSNKNSVLQVGLGYKF